MISKRKCSIKFRTGVLEQTRPTGLVLIITTWKNSAIIMRENESEELKQMCEPLNLKHAWLL